MRATRGGVGSNQYESRGSAQPAATPDTRFAVLDGLQQMHQVQSERGGSPRVIPTRVDESTDPELEALAVSASANDRAGVAGGSGASESLLRRLADDPDPVVSVRVAMNPNTPPEVLAAMGERDWKTLRTVLRNPSCPPEVLQRAWDGRTTRPPHAMPDLVAGLCGNSNTPATVLTDAVQVSPDALAILPTKPWAPPEALEMCADKAKNDRALAVCIRNPSFPSDQIPKRVGRKKSMDLWMAAASNPSAPTEFLDRCAAHSNPDIRQVVATNASLSESSLENLLFDENEAVKSAALTRELPEHLAAAMAFLDTF